jgi:hypothetical protein
MTELERALWANRVVADCLAECQGDVDAALEAADIILENSIALGDFRESEHPRDDSGQFASAKALEASRRAHEATRDTDHDEPLVESKAAIGYALQAHKTADQIRALGDISTERKKRAHKILQLEQSLLHESAEADHRRAARAHLRVQYTHDRSDADLVESHGRSSDLHVTAADLHKRLSANTDESLSDITLAVDEGGREHRGKGARTPLEEYPTAPPTAAPIGAPPDHTQARAQASTDSAELAWHYAELFNAMRELDVPVPDEMLTQANEELHDSGWCLQLDEVAGAESEGEWVVYPAPTGGVHLAVAHAPKGGISIGGERFRGGQFIPGEVMARATPEEVAKVKGVGAPGEQRLAQRGHLTIDNVRAKLRGFAPHDPDAEAAAIIEEVHRVAGTRGKNGGDATIGEAERIRRRQLVPHEMESARKSFNAILRHHGALTVHRIDELIDATKEALRIVRERYKKFPSSGRWFERRLSAYGHMLTWARQHGITGQLPAGLEPRGAGGGGAAGAGNFRPRIVTARPEETGRAAASVDTGLVPQGLREHLISPDGSDHQLVGTAMAIRALDAHGGFMLADGPGGGKTRQMLATAAAMTAKGKSVLLVAPAGIIKPDWKRNEIGGSIGKDGAAMGVPLTLNKGDQPLVPGQCYVTTYEQLARIRDKIGKDTVVMFDEAHGLKNATSARAQHGKAIAQAAGGVLYGTATPADDAADIAYTFRAQIQPPPIEETIKKLTSTKIPASDRLAATRAVFDRLTERGLMVKREISLDGVEVHFDTVQLPTDALADLDALAKEAGGDSKRKAQLLMRQRFAQERHKIPAAVKTIQEELAQGRQCVVFVAGVGAQEEGEGLPVNEGTAALLRKALAHAGVPDSEIAELHGGEAGEGKEAVARFQGTSKEPGSKRARVLITTAASGGTGHNLDDTVGNAPRTQIIVTAPFSAIDNAQMWGRTHRLTTRSASRIRYLFANTPVDDWNASLISGKVATLGAIVAGETERQNVPARAPEKPGAPAANGKASLSISAFLAHDITNRAPSWPPSSTATRATYPPSTTWRRSTARSAPSY